MNKFIDLYKRVRTRNYLKKSYSGKYAFVGIGNHSIHNLYPVLKYLNVPLKYIVSRTKETADAVAQNLGGVTGTNDFDMVLSDKEISGVFICANPTQHFALTLKALQNNKNVFVEKPPCTNMEELEKLIEAQKKTGKTCLVGMQKRYSPATAILKKNLKKDEMISYNYRYVTGSYPEGDEVLDMYIHPLDLIGYLFGDFNVLSVVNTNSDRKEKSGSVFLHLKHGNVVGNIEISTSYSWNCSEEILLVNMKSGVLKMENHESVMFQKKQMNLFGIPLEKISPNPVEIKHLYHRNNFTPVMSNNQLFTMGYYNELSTFINLAENGKGSNLSALEQLKLTFVLINEINKSYVH